VSSGCGVTMSEARGHRSFDADAVNSDIGPQGNARVALSHEEEGQPP